MLMIGLLVAKKLVVVTLMRLLTAVYWHLSRQCSLIRYRHLISRIHHRLIHLHLRRLVVYELLLNFFLILIIFIWDIYELVLIKILLFYLYYEASFADYL